MAKKVTENEIDLGTGLQGHPSIRDDVATQDDPVQSTGTELAVAAEGEISALKSRYYDEAGNPLPFDTIKDRILFTCQRMEKLSVEMMLDLYFVHKNWRTFYKRGESFRQWVMTELPVTYGYCYDVISVIEMLLIYEAKRITGKEEAYQVGCRKAINGRDMWLSCIECNEQCSLYQRKRKVEYKDPETIQEEAILFVADAIRKSGIGVLKKVQRMWRDDLKASLLERIVDQHQMFTLNEIETEEQKYEEKLRQVEEQLEEQRKKRQTEEAARQAKQDALRHSPEARQGDASEPEARDAEVVGESDEDEFGDEEEFEKTETCYDDAENVTYKVKLTFDGDVFVEDKITNQEYLLLAFGSGIEPVIKNRIFDTVLEYFREERTEEEMETV